MLDRKWDWDDPAVSWVECRGCDARTQEDIDEQIAAWHWNRRIYDDGPAEEEII